MKSLVLLFLLSLLSLPTIVFAQSDTSRCVGPYTLTTSDTKSFDFSKTGGCDIATVTVKLVSGALSAQVFTSLDATSGDFIPKDHQAGTALPALSASGFQQFDGPWMFVKFVASSVTGSVSYNICCKAF